MDRPNKFGVSVFVHQCAHSKRAQLFHPGSFMLTAIRILQPCCRQSRLPARCCATDPYSPDSFLGEFLFRVERSNFAEAGG